MKSSSSSSLRSSESYAFFLAAAFLGGGALPLPLALGLGAPASAATSSASHCEYPSRKASRSAVHSCLVEVASSFCSSASLVSSSAFRLSTFSSVRLHRGIESR